MGRTITRSGYMNYGVIAEEDGNGNYDVRTLGMTYGTEVRSGMVLAKIQAKKNKHGKILAWELDLNGAIAETPDELVDEARELVKHWLTWRLKDISDGDRRNMRHAPVNNARWARGS